MGGKHGMVLPRVGQTSWEVPHFFAATMGGNHRKTMGKIWENALKTGVLYGSIIDPNGDFSA